MTGIGMTTVTSRPVMNGAIFMTQITHLSDEQRHQLITAQDMSVDTDETAHPIVRRPDRLTTLIHMHEMRRVELQLEASASLARFEARARRYDMSGVE